MKQSKREKRAGAIYRLETSTWDNSKAKRLGTKTKSEWETQKETHLEQLKEMH
jgi:hypothetical protein